jgi:glycogen operon protein
MNETVNAPLPETAYLETGAPQPPGSSWTGRGTNFAVFSAHATRVELCLYDSSGRRETADSPVANWRYLDGFLPARLVGPARSHGYRVHGAHGLRTGTFNQRNSWWILRLALEGGLDWHPSLKGAEADNDWIADSADSAPHVPKSRVVDTAFDWGGVRAPSVPWRDTMIYELHVKGFTQRHPGVPHHLRGKYLASRSPWCSTT